MRTPNTRCALITLVVIAMFAASASAVIAQDNTSARAAAQRGVSVTALMAKGAYCAGRPWKTTYDPGKVNIGIPGEKRYYARFKATVLEPLANPKEGEIEQVRYKPKAVSPAKVVCKTQGKFDGSGGTFECSEGLYKEGSWKGLSSRRSVWNKRRFRMFGRAACVVQNTGGGTRPLYTAWSARRR